MADLAVIGFRAETDELDKAKTKLNDLGPAAERAEKGASKLTSIFSGLGKVTGMLSNVMKGFIAGAAGAFVGFFAAISFDRLLSGLANVAARIDDVSKAASKMQESMKNMQALGLAADLAGLDFNALATAGQRMNKVLGEAIAKGKENEGVFKMIGVSAKELAAMPITDRFAFLADTLEGFNLTADQTALVLAKLGDRSGALTALFDGGGQAIRDAAEMMERFNGTLTNEQGKEVEAMNDSFTALGYAIEAMGNKIVAFFAPAITVVVNAFANFIGAVNVGFGKLMSVVQGFFAPFVRIAVGAWNLVASGAGLLVDKLNKFFGVDIIGAAKTGVNYIVNLFSAAFQQISIIWGAFPEIIGAAAIGAANMAIAGVNKMVAGAIQALNGLAQYVASVFGAEAGGLIDPKTFEIPKFDNPFSANAGQAFTDAAAAANAQMKVDNFATAVTGANEATKSAKGTLGEFNNELGNTASKAGGAAEKLTELQKINNEISALTAPFDQAKQAYDALQQAQTNGIITGDAYTAMLGRIQAAFIATGGTATQWSKVIAGKTSEMTTALKDFATNALTQVGDAFISLAVTGKASFADLTKSILTDLLKMMWQMYIVKPLIGGLFGFADGGVFGGGTTAFAKGGVVNSPTTFGFADGGSFRRGLMGEAGPEAIMPLKRGRDGALGVQVNGGNGGGRSVQMGDMNFYFDGGGATDEAGRQDLADKIGTSVYDQLALYVDERIMDANQYGGIANPRGY